MNLDAPTLDSTGDDGQFLLAEYSEAAAAYFKGVDVGLTSLKQFVGTSAALLALVHSKIVPSTVIFNLKIGTEFILATVGLAMCCILFAMLNRYFTHLENCRSRCEELEAMFGGKLFTRLGRISEESNTGMNTLSTLRWIFGLFVFCWLFTLANLLYSFYKL